MIDAENGWYAVPATIKAVVVSPSREVLLARNHRNKWELPGGWPAAEDVSIEDVLRREVLEETGLHVSPAALLHAELVVVDGSQVMVVAYLCHACARDLNLSSEHIDLIWAPADALPQLELNAYERAISEALAAHVPPSTTA